MDKIDKILANHPKKMFLDYQNKDSKLPKYFDNIFEKWFIIINISY